MRTALHALVVDDQEPIQQEVRDRLEAMGHTCCLAGSSEAAQLLIEQGSRTYDYVVLDLEIPTRFGRPPMISVGELLIEVVRSRLGAIPIIVITSHGVGSPELAIEVLRGGGARADDFINKPFPVSGKGRTLETAVSELLSMRSKEKGKVFSRPMSGGELVFYPDRVTLEGIQVAGEAGGTLIRRILDRLQVKDAHQRYVRLKGSDLAKQIGLEATEATMNGAVRDFRKHVTELLLTEASIHCPQQGVIESGTRGTPGYRLAVAIHVRVEKDPWRPDSIVQPQVASEGGGDVVPPKKPRKR